MTQGTSSGTYRIRKYIYNKLTHEVEIQILYEGDRAPGVALCVLQNEELRPKSATYGLCVVTKASGTSAVGFSVINTDGIITQGVTGDEVAKILIYIKYVI